MVGRDSLTVMNLFLLFCSYQISSASSMMQHSKYLKPTSSLVSLFANGGRSANGLTGHSVKRFSTNEARKHAFSNKDSTNAFNSLTVLSLVGAGAYLSNANELSNSNRATTKCYAAASESGLLETRTEEVTITDLEAELIANSLYEDLVSIPGVPKHFERLICQMVIKTFVSAIPTSVTEEEFNTLISGEADDRNVKRALINAVSDKLYIPFVSKEAQIELVNKLGNAFLVEPNLAPARHRLLVRSLKGAADVEHRQTVADELNANVDVPLLGEGQEQVMAEKFVELGFGTLEFFTPTAIKDLIRASSPEELIEVRTNMLDRLNEKINIPFVSEEDERIAYASVVDLFLGYYGLADGTKPKDEQLEDVQRELEMCTIELDSYREHMVGKEKDMVDNLAKLKTREEALLKDLK